MLIFKENAGILTQATPNHSAWKALLQELPVPAGVLNASGQWVMTNQLAYQWLGNGKTLEWCQAEDVARMQEAIAALKPATITIRVKETSGHPQGRCVRLTLVPLQQKGNYWLGVMEPADGDAALPPFPIHSDVVFRHLVEMAPIMIGIYVDGEIQYVNPAGVRLMGAKSRHELIGRNVMEFIHPESLPIVEQRKQALLQKAVVLPPVEERLIRLDGQVIDVEVVTTRLSLEGGLAILAVGQDITRRKQAERALKESEDRYFHLMRVSPNAIFIIQQSQVRYVNPAGVQLLGARNREELLGKPLETFLPVFRGQFQLLDEASWQGRPLETRLFPLEGFPLEVDVIATPVMLEGQVAMQLIVRDISERKRAEAQLKESRDRLRELSVYLQTVRENERAHIAREIHDELGQMLTALKLDLALFKRRLPEEKASLFQAIDAMSQMVDETVKVVRRIAAELRPEILDDLGLLAAIEWQAQEYQRRSGIKIYIQFEPDDFTVDRNRATTIFRIFQETLTNVVRHARATEVFVTLVRKEGGLELVVEDNGVGIEPSAKEKRWALGIMGMKERARFWNGEVTIKGEPGEGTRVQVWIPEEGHE